MTEDLTPIVREFEVRCSVEHAFDTWTRRINLWWPRAGHSVAQENMASVTIEPRRGGRIFETTRRGHQILWGTVNIWEPPNRFGYLWHLGELDASEATQVTITFIALDSRRTRTRIEHKGWENAGPNAGPRRGGNEWGWDKLIPAFTDLIAGDSDTHAGRRQGEQMTQAQAFESRTAVVVGASSGFGRGVVDALVARKMRVVAVALGADRLNAVAKETGAQTLVADVADETAAWRILQQYRPNLVVLTAGASPLLRPLHNHTWETFSVNWQVDTKGTFLWLRDALLLPAAPGSHFIVTSSAAAVRGSPLSGGYAGAKKMNWFLAQYAAATAKKLGLGLHIHCLVPTLSPDTPIGQAASAAYAKAAGVDLATFLKSAGPPTTPAIIGDAVVNLHASPEKWEHTVYSISGNGLSPIPSELPH